MSWDNLFTWGQNAWRGAWIQTDATGRTDVLYCGNPSVEYEALTTKAALLVSPLWVPLVVEGEDAVDYLHRRLSQSILDLPPGQGRPALQLTGDGRMQAELLVYRGDGAFFLLTPRDSANVAWEALDQFIFMDDVIVHRQWEAEAVIALAGPLAPRLLAALGMCSDASTGPEAWSAHFGVELGGMPCRVFGDGRWPVPFYHICIPLTALQPLAELLAQTLASVDGRCAGLWAGELLRIEAGLPRHGADTSVSTIPLEAGLESSLNFDKGCYPGQEVIARITNLGHPARQLVRLAIKGEFEFESGAALMDGDRSVGVLTSSMTWPGLDHTAALGYLKWGDRELPQVDVSLAGAKISARVYPREVSQKGSAQR